MKKNIFGAAILAFNLSTIIMTSIHAEDQEALAKTLNNPVAALISAPFQFNYDTDIGVDDTGDQYQLKIQPVIPIELNEDWNVISRTIIPIIYQDDIFAGAGSQTGLGNITQSFFFSPKQPTENGWIWGAGPAITIPTASHRLLGGDQWSAGPTAVVLKQEGPWTYGGLASHIWSFADDKNQEVSATFLQPFLGYVTSDAVTYSLNTESTYDWEAEQWSVPINAMITKMMKFGNQNVSIGGGIRYWVENPDAGPEGWGIRLQMTLLFPK